MTGKVLLYNANVYRRSRYVAEWEKPVPSAAVQDGERGSILPLEEVLCDWVALSDGKILAYGKGSEAKDTEEYVEFDKVDCKGATVLPGLIDAHIHIYLLGRSLLRCNLRGSASIEELQHRLRQHLSHTESADWTGPQDPWLCGEGWSQDTLGRLPTRQDLDAISTDRPIFLYRACFHIAVVNTKVLEMIGALDGGTFVCPEGGVLDKAPDGTLTGILRETACDAVAQYMEDISDDIREEYLLSGLNACLKAGLTQVQTNDTRAWGVYAHLDREQRLPLRVLHTPLWDEAINPKQPKDSSQARSRELPGKAGFVTESGLLRADRLKLFADGSLGSETAALRHPYLCANGRASGESHSHGSSNGAFEKPQNNCGMLIDEPQVLQSKVQKAAENGWRLEIHAIGDLAADVALQALEKSGIDGAKAMPILTHCQLLGKDLCRRMSKLGGVVADVQPSFVPTDKDFIRARLAPDSPSLEVAYAWKTLLRSTLATNVVVAGSSDAPVETCDPLIGMRDAMLRGGPEDPYLPEECLNFDEALHLYTISAARAGNMDALCGEIAAGRAADLTVIALEGEQPACKLWEMDAAQFGLRINGGATTVQAVYVNGKRCL
eukprot:Clim_evm4s159 gene=Clim_evmTU4s159